MPGSPWNVNVHSPLNVTFNSDGIRFIPVGKLAEFEVQVSGDDGSSGGQLGVNVTCTFKFFRIVCTLNMIGLHVVTCDSLLILTDNNCASYSEMAPGVPLQNRQCLF